MGRRFIRQVVRLREFNRWSFGGGGQLDVSEEVLARAAAPRITSHAVEDIDLLKPPPPPDRLVDRAGLRQRFTPTQIESSPSSLEVLLGL